MYYLRPITIVHLTDVTSNHGNRVPPSVAHDRHQVAQVQWFALEEEEDDNDDDNEEFEDYYDFENYLDPVSELALDCEARHSNSKPMTVYMSPTLNDRAALLLYETPLSNDRVTTVILVMGPKPLEHRRWDPPFNNDRISKSFD
jgi:hypothetical protein